MTLFASRQKCLIKKIFRHSPRQNSVDVYQIVSIPNSTCKWHSTEATVAAISHKIVNQHKLCATHTQQTNRIIETRSLPEMNLKTFFGIFLEKLSYAPSEIDFSQIFHTNYDNNFLKNIVLRNKFNLWKQNLLKPPEFVTLLRQWPSQVNTISSRYDVLNFHDIPNLWYEVVLVKLFLVCSNGILWIIISSTSIVHMYCIAICADKSNKCFRLHWTYFQI